MIRLYLKITENFVRLIFQEKFRVVLIPFVRMVKFKFLIQYGAIDCGIVVSEFVLQSCY